MLSPAALGQTAAARTGTSGAVTAAAAALANPGLQAQVALSAANLAKAAQAIKDMNLAQAAARASSQLTLNGAKLDGKLAGSAWNGAVLSGLKPVDDTGGALWTNAERLQKDTASATATVKQTAANALLTWQSFDLDTGETLVFDQQDHADWTVLNRIVAGPRDADGSRFVASPSMILGKIQAPGSVYVINPNGIIFGPTAQINVHSLIASALDVGNALMSQGERDGFFLNTGILGNGGTIPEASFSYHEEDKVVEGDVRVEAGAILTTSLAPRSVSPDAGGFVYLFAPNVENDGTIITPAGETMLVSAQQVQLIANAYPDGGILTTSANTRAQTFRAVGVNTTTFASATVPHPDVWRRDGPASAQISAPGSVINRGFIDAERGVVILNGDNVINGASAETGAGIIRANTSVTRDGEIFLDARLQLTVDGSIQVLPDENGETIPQSAIASFNAGSVEMRGNVISLNSGALVAAPGGSVSVNGLDTQLGIYPGDIGTHLPVVNPRIYMAPDSQIDVSGLAGVSLPMSDNLVTFKPFGNEFADQPLQRQGALRGQSLTVDIRETGSLNGVDWVGTPLANVSGFANNIQRSIDQLLTTGGTVTLSGSTDGEIVLRQGSAINVAGGYVQYEGGVVETSKLITADGRIVDIAKADPLDTFVGIAGITNDVHAKWGFSQSFGDSLLTGGEFQAGYVEGRDAGGVVLDAASYALDGAFYAGAIAGDRQRFLGERPSAAAANTRRADPAAMPSAGYLTLRGRNNLIVSADVAPLPDDFALADKLPQDRIDNARLAASALTDAAFGRIAADFKGHLEVTADAALSVVPGGTLSLAGGSVDIKGALTARSGTIAIQSTGHIAGDSLGNSATFYKPDTLTPPPGLFDLTIGPGAVLDASGMWVNDKDATPDTLIGGAFVDGGSVTLQTQAQSASCSTVSCTGLAGLGAGVSAIVDLTGNIVLSEGSLIDVSSGGRVTDHGVVQLDSKGRPVGKGGSVSFQTYVGGFSTQRFPAPPTTSEPAARLVLGGSDGTPAANAQALNTRISAFGFSQGGILSIQTAAIQIGGATPEVPDALMLPADFFAGNAFGGYVLGSVSSGLTIASGTNVVLQQRNLVEGDGLDLTTLATGTKPTAFAAIDYLPDIIRAPVNLTLEATLPPLPFAPYDPASAAPAARVALRIEEDAVIEGDPGASIGIDVAGRREFTPNNQGTFNAAIARQIGVAEILGTVEAPGGTITLSADLAEIWLGANSRLDVSGAVVSDTRQPFRTGSVLPGGTVTIASKNIGDGNSSLVAFHGALIDVSGAAGTFDLLRDVAGNGLNGPLREAAPVWSDAGAIKFAIPTVLYDGSFAAAPGAGTGKGGSLTISVPLSSGQEITVQQAGDVVPAGLTPTDDVASILKTEFADRFAPGSTLEPLLDFVFFQADRLTGSGMADVTLSASPILGDTVGTQGQFAPGRIVFSGNVTIEGLDSLALDASGISITDASGALLADPLAPADPRGCNVCLDARYVALRGSGNPTQFTPKAGAGIFQATGDTIDLAAGGLSASGEHGLLSLSGIADARFESTGDIRLRVPLANIPFRLAPGGLAAGELITAGNLAFEAAQIYPISAVDITLKSLAPEGTIAFGRTASHGAAPLSAGGQVTVSAVHIEQAGTLLAPLGIIRLGAQTADDLSPNDPARNYIFTDDPTATAAARPTKTVTLADGRTTSVSLAGQTVPFGETANTTSWSYDSDTGQPLSAPPGKELVVSGAAIDVAAGATVDISGGGAIQSMEFVPGIGGTRDVLARNANVYAVIPGYNPLAAPLDLDFLVQQHDAVPEAGLNVYLSGEGGLPAGYYTLLPAHYATLPGAYRVALVANSQDALTSQNAVLPDGTLRMAGYFADPGLGTRAARTNFFDVQSSDVWRLYSEIDHIAGTEFFRIKTVGESELPPPLPVDAGHAVFSAISGLNLDGILQAAAASGGRGAQFDIAAQDLQILSPSETARAGYVGVDATQLSNLHAESLLLGGIRDGDGQTIDVVANSVEVGNDASSPLEAPEIILVTKAGGGQTDPNAGRALRFDGGSVVRAVGDVADKRPKTVTIGHLHDKTNPGDPPNVSGSGALVAVSNGAPLAVRREDAGTNGTITFIGPDALPGVPGAIVEGASLTLDTSGVIRLNSGVTVTADDISVSARSINIGQVSGTPGGFIVFDDILAQFVEAKTLTLRSTGLGINFYGDVGLSLGKPGSRLVLDTGALAAKTGGSVTLKADEVDLSNSGEAIATVAGTGTLEIDAANMTLGAGAKAFGGFADVTFAGTGKIALRDPGTIDGGAADLSFETPLFLVGSGANQSVTTTGMVGFATPSPGTPSGDGEIGGTFAVTAASIALKDGALVQVNAGGVTLEAVSGDLTLGVGARLLANGVAQDFFDVTRVAPGGAVRLIADQGNIDADPSSAIDVSSPAGYTGNAGSIALIAPHGHIGSNGAAFAAATIAGSVAGDHGGRLEIKTQSLGAESVSIPAIFSDTVDLHLSQGDLALGSDLAAANVTLTVDQGVLTIGRKIDASGERGGSISLFGGRGVVLATGAQLLATASDANKRGGDILIGTEVAGANGSADPGVIDLQAGLIDVSNLANPENGGTVRLRAPLTDSNTNVAITTVNTTIAGASSVTIEGFEVFDTHNSAFNGTIDPAGQPGFYGACTVTASGPDCSGTLIDFVQHFALSADAKAKFASVSTAVLHLQPGIELVNDDPTVNNGDITIASSWNFGAGLAGYLEGDINSHFGGVFQGKLVNAVAFTPKGQPTVTAGTIVTDDYGNLLPQYSKYKGALEFVDGVSVITTTVVTDQYGNLTDPFTKYKGPLVFIDGESQITRTVVTDQYGILTDNYKSYKGDLLFVPGVSQITSLYYRVDGEHGTAGEPGTLTLRAIHDVEIDHSITDGFFQTRNVFDDNYQANLTRSRDPNNPSVAPGWILLAYGFQPGTNVSNVGGYLIGGATYADPVPILFGDPGPAPTAPYDAKANSIGPVFSSKDKIPLTGADLFPLIPDVNGPIQGPDGNYRAIASWSYRVVGGADTASANPLAVKPLSEFGDVADKKAAPYGGFGNVAIDGHREFNVFNYGSLTNVTYETPTIVRTGTGSIDIAAGRDFILADTKAPGVVYTAGRNSAALPDPGFTLKTIDDPLNPGETISMAFASDPTGFLNPVVLNCDLGNQCNPYGPLGAAAYPVDGGHLTLTAQRDILGFEHTTIASPSNGTGFDNQQYFAPWLLAQGAALPITDFGAFSPLSGYLSTGEIFTPSQTSWWINFGSFDQGLLSAGGDVRVAAGRDIQELAVSLPTTARVSGGLSSTITDANGKTVANVPVVHLDGSGDLSVIAGRDLKSGAYYEGSGDAKIVVGGSVSASWLDREDNTAPAAFPVSTVLALDTGTMTLIARGDTDIAGVVSAASLQNVADLTGNFDVLAQQVSTYGPSSKLTLQSIAGDLTANSLSFVNALINNVNVVFNFGGDPGQGYPGGEGYAGINRYPASFEAVALKGDLQIANSFRLAPSDDGTLSLLAYGSLHTSNTSGDVRPISSGPSIVEAVFDAAEPLAGFGPAQGALSLDLGARLLHVGDTEPDLFYAATGDIQAGAGPSAPSGERPLGWEINKPAKVRAAEDIVDLSFFGQNLAVDDVTQIIAGRDLYYTGAWQDLIGLAPGVLGEPQNQGGLGLAGPGFFDIEAGRNLGPFVTAAADIAATKNGSTVDPNGTGIITFGNTVVAGNRRLLSDRDPALADPFAHGANDKLPRQGADIVALFGVGNGVDYQAAIDTYIKATDPQRDYAPALADYLLTLGKYTLEDWTNFSQSPNGRRADLFNAFDSLSGELQHIFVDRIFFDELRLPGDSLGCCFRQYSLGYAMIETLFPPAFGYTDNRVPADGSMDAPGAIGDFGIYAGSPSKRIGTGDLEMLHATIKTLQSAEDFTVRVSGLDAATADVGQHVVRIGGEIAAGDVFSETMNGTAYLYTAAEGDTADEVAAGLRDAILAGAPDGVAVGAVGKGTASFTLMQTRAGTVLSAAAVSKAASVADTARVLGGDILMFGPGGNINVGTTALEINAKLTNSSLGILTLDNGVIDVFTDGSVLVNQSRILTVQGGDVLMWSSNADLDAGRGAKTSVDFKPLSVTFDPRDLQTINLNGLVSGAGIGTIQSTPDAPVASAFLIAPRGTVNFGDAGVRSSGNLDVAALFIANAQNAVVNLSNNALPAASVDLGALQNTSAVAGQAAQAAADAVAAAANQGNPVAAGPAPSLITVEVLGFGNCDPEGGVACGQ